MYLNVYGCAHTDTGGVYKSVSECTTSALSLIANTTTNNSSISQTNSDSGSGGSNACQQPSYLYLCFNRSLLSPAGYHGSAANGSMLTDTGNMVPCGGTEVEALVPTTYALDTPRPYVSTVFFMSFVVMGSWIMLSLFMVGV